VVVRLLTETHIAFEVSDYHEPRMSFLYNKNFNINNRQSSERPGYPEQCRYYTGVFKVLSRVNHRQVFLSKRLLDRLIFVQIAAVLTDIVTGIRLRSLFIFAQTATSRKTKKLLSATSETY
jgi:hypothetical protein